MTLEEAIRYYEEQAKKCNNRVNEIILGAERCEQDKQEYTQLAEWLRELKERREERRWIPASERLPEIGERTLVTKDDGNIYVARCKHEEYMDCFYGDVIAWMPSPKPYKAERITDD